MPGHCDPGRREIEDIGRMDRAKAYMEYYDEEEPIWNFSDDIVEYWEDIYT